jgi:23S rRNA pseudouridine1911/1915/1917 synthase
VEPYSILYEDEDILIANKLAPIPVQPEKTGDRSLQDLLRDELDARGGARTRGAFLEAAHRIDRRASGAVLFAKTHIALSTLEAAFRDKRVAKEYIACVEREPEPATGRLEHRLAWDKRRNVVRALRPDSVSGKPAVLEYRVAGRSDHYFFVSVNLITGRHHQVRAQLSAIGCPIRGDLKYGARRSSPSGLIMLHAKRIALDQPRTAARVDVAAPFPQSEPLWSAFIEGSDGIGHAGEVAGGAPGDDEAAAGA